MNIEYPEVFSLLLLLIPLAAIFFLGYLQGQKHINSIAGNWHLQRFRGVFLVKYVSAAFFFFLALFFLVLALAGLYWGYEAVEDERTGVELVFAVDISNSMFAQDIRPNRLTRVTNIIRAIVRNVSDIWFALVAFKGSAIQILPVTQDTIVLEGSLATLHPNILTTPGTNVEDGIRAALNAFSSQMNKISVILLFTDGEELSGNVMRTAVEAFDRGVVIFPVAVGTAEGATIPAGGENVIRKADGAPVISKLRIPVLDKLAQRTGGQVFNITEPGSIAMIVENIMELRKNREVERVRSTRLLRYRVFALLALLCLVLYVLIQVIKWQDTL